MSSEPDSFSNAPLDSDFLSSPVVSCDFCFAVPPDANPRLEAADYNYFAQVQQVLTMKQE